MTDDPTRYLRDVKPADVARRLRVVMHIEGIRTTNELAVFLGVRRSRVAAWLNAYNLPRVEEMSTLVSLVRYLTLDWIYLGKLDGVPTKMAIRLQAEYQGIDCPVSRGDHSARDLAPAAVETGLRT